ncbi:hypothetical protein GIB67_023648 [Kingdonia uniflora]|uniref:Uncharacterized protein n=1 Tax=Kingdonia uniflora TaxID=39325 RepID=A0A7J7M2C9_9MAGN|nr:hypothetical protein GIB67_023648 [Kingdonia uniflora]
MKSIFFRNDGSIVATASTVEHALKEAFECGRTCNAKAAAAVGEVLAMRLKVEGLEHGQGRGIHANVHKEIAKKGFSIILSQPASIYIKQYGKLTSIVAPLGDGVIAELEPLRLREEEAMKCNNEFKLEFDNIHQTFEESADQYVKVELRLVKSEKTANELTQKIESKEAELGRVQEEVLRAQSEVEKLNGIVSRLKGGVLATRSRDEDHGQYRIRGLEVEVKELAGQLNNVREGLRRKEVALVSARASFG